MNDSVTKQSLRDDSFVATDEVGMREQLIRLIERLNQGIQDYEGVS